MDGSPVVTRPMRPIGGYHSLAMPIVVAIIAALFGLVGLYTGARTLRRWDESNDPDYFRDVVHQGVMVFLKLGLLLLMLATAAIAVVAGVAADRGGADLPGGVWLCLAVTIAISIGFIASYRKHRRA